MVRCHGKKPFLTLRDESLHAPQMSWVNAGRDIACNSLPVKHLGQFGGI